MLRGDAVRLRSERPSGSVCRPCGGRSRGPAAPTGRGPECLAPALLNGVPRRATGSTTARLGLPRCAEVNPIHLRAELGHLSLPAHRPRLVSSDARRVVGREPGVSPRRRGDLKVVASRQQCVRSAPPSVVGRTRPRTRTVRAWRRDRTSAAGVEGLQCRRRPARTSKTVVEDPHDHPQGRARRDVVLAPTTAAVIDAYVGDREAGPVFITKNGTRLDQPGAFRLIRRIAKAAGIEHADRISPHSLRHTFVTLAREAGALLEDVQVAARHADPRTTRRHEPRPTQSRQAPFVHPGRVPRGLSVRPTTSRDGVRVQRRGRRGLAPGPKARIEDGAAI
ncbi:tyrosine-type recombinase/integrase [Nocardioides sp. NBC_00163]|uniref:tyrosine-type recombinase/integrase n=1 Tax=Nocardioides sp. NBC_00163 TaxID=2975999 RepID=UPI003865F7C5